MLCVSFQSVPECDEERRANEEDGRGNKEEETEQEEEDERSSDEGFMGMTPLLQAHHAMEKMEEFVHKAKKHTHTHAQFIWADVGEHSTFNSTTR